MFRKSFCFFFFFFFILGFGSVLFSQNLVINPGFEEHDTFVTNISVTDSFANHNIKGWYVPTNSSIHFYDTTENFDPIRFLEPTKPCSGDSYVQGALYWDGGERMYIGGEFSKPLELGKRYKFSMHMALGFHSTYAVDTVGVFFNKSKVSQNTNNVMTYIIPQLQIGIKNAFVEKCKWVEISGYYTAIGGEKYFIVGNFKKQPPVKKNVSHTLGSSYLFDDFSMIISNDKESPAIAPGKKIVKDNIHFKTGDSTLSADSYPALDEIISELKKQPNLKVEIDGHTDNTGTPEANQKLSEARARAVANYFISKGIIPKRIKTKGYGSSKPISNDPAKNRRVEFVFY